MSSDDLEKPLGVLQRVPRLALPNLPFPLPRPWPVAAAVSLASVLTLVTWMAMSHNPLGGEPFAVVAVDLTSKGKGESAPAQTAKAEEPAKAEGGRTITIVDGASGKTTQVTVPAPERAVGLDPRLNDGLPRIAPDGKRPLDAYARPFIPRSPGEAALPRIALVVGGLGISNQTTQDAVSKLPGPVSLAFAPYGPDLEARTAKARESGHEILLHLPLEPFDYPENDPGPQTLLSTLPAEQNIERLHWSMSRFTGYIGLLTYMGGKFTASDTALQPVMQEMTRRGLLFVDEGGNVRSLAAQVAGQAKAPFVRGDVVIDRLATGAEIDKALQQLEAQARDQGFAIGVGSALPITIERIARWAPQLEKKGIVLVPVSNMVVGRKSQG